ncbi:MAG: hypothetical protein ACKPKO_07810 [Candidatus Fonsibacter sp.]
MCTNFVIVTPTNKRSYKFDIFECAPGKCLVFVKYTIYDASRVPECFVLLEIFDIQRCASCFIERDARRLYVCDSSRCVNLA